MKLEIIVLAVTGFLVANAYHDGKYTKYLQVNKKYFQRYLVIGEVVYFIAGSSNYGGEPEYVERWIDENSNFKKETKKLIDGRIQSPEVFAVSDDYCDF